MILQPRRWPGWAAFSPGSGVGRNLLSAPFKLLAGVNYLQRRTEGPSFLQAVVSPGSLEVHGPLARPSPEAVHNTAVCFCKARESF